MYVLSICPLHSNRYKFVRQIRKAISFSTVMLHIKIHFESRLCRVIPLFLLLAFTGYMVVTVLVVKLQLNFGFKRSRYIFTISSSAPPITYYQKYVCVTLPIKSSLKWIVSKYNFYTTVIFYYLIKGKLKLCASHLF